MKAIALLTFVLVALNPVMRADARPTRHSGPAISGWLSASGIDLEGASTQQGHSERAASQPANAAQVEYLRTPACTSNDPNRSRPFDGSCAYATATCALRGAPSSSMTWVWRRPATRPGKRSARWEWAGELCLSPVRKATRPTLTLAMVQRAFRHLDFAHPQVRIQPEGTTTLVNLPTYYRVHFPTTGIAPHQTTTLTLLGLNLRIRPTALSYTYTYGDGTHSNPTPDPGGTYPNGHITHTYQHPGNTPTHITTRYSADYSVQHGPWQHLNDTLDITGPTTTLHVREAHAHLLAGTSH